MAPSDQSRAISRSQHYLNKANLVIHRIDCVKVDIGSGVNFLHQNFKFSVHFASYCPKYVHILKFWSCHEICFMSLVQFLNYFYSFSNKHFELQSWPIKNLNLGVVIAGMSCLRRQPLQVFDADSIITTAVTSCVSFNWCSIFRRFTTTTLVILGPMNWLAMPQPNSNA